VVRHQIPAVYAYRDFAIAGGLMTYGPSVTAADRTAGNYLGRILQGAPCGSPRYSGSKNRPCDQSEDRARCKLGIPIPILGLADDVIE
jgi:putative ABC transport system substrate-binding protein